MTTPKAPSSSLGLSKLGPSTLGPGAPAPTFERYWMSPVTSRWNVDGSTWLNLAYLRQGDYESSEGCFMALEGSGEIWEYCRDAARSLNGVAPFVIGKYRPLRA